MKPLAGPWRSPRWTTIFRGGASSTATGTAVPVRVLVDARPRRGRRRARPADAGADVVDLDGGLLAPGFLDAHVHPVQGGLERIRCDLRELRTREDYLAGSGATPTRIPT